MLEERMANNENGGDRYSHTRWLRERLRDARKEQGLTALEVDRRIVAALKEERKPNPQRIYHWENLAAHPSIAAYAAWSRALGFRLVVQLVDAGSEARSVLVRSDDAARVALLLDAAPPEKREAIARMVETLLG